LSKGKKKKESEMKRVLSIQDMSYFGKCSQTVALPVLSAMGIETVPLVTSVLTSHTQIPGFRVKDMSSFIPEAIEQWKNLPLHFDAIYTGYLGSRQDVQYVMEILDAFKGEDTLFIMDPAMADDGKLYPGFDEAYAAENRRLAAKADLAVPNLSEISLLTGSDYHESCSREEYQTLLKKFADLGCKEVMLTGASLSEGMTGVYGYNRVSGEFYSCQNEKVGGSYHGTGDLFSSVLVGAVLHGKSYKEAAEIASSYVQKTVLKASEEDKRTRYSVPFESTLPELIRVIGLND
jgi:pyridoxine kinase